MSQESVSIFGTCRDCIRHHFNHAKLHAWKAKHKARHTFTSFNKAKREAQYNEGFHFSSYPNNSVIVWLEQNDRRANSTNEPSIKTYCRQYVWLTMLLCSYEANRDQCTLESLKRFLVCPEEPSYFNILILSKRTLCEKSEVVVRKVVPCILIKVSTNSISCSRCLDVSDILYCLHCWYLCKRFPFRWWMI